MHSPISPLKSQSKNLSKPSSRTRRRFLSDETQTPKNAPHNRPTTPTLPPPTPHFEIPSRNPPLPPTAANPLPRSTSVHHELDLVLALSEKLQYARKRGDCGG